jgi:hypothetical protein
VANDPIEERIREVVIGEIESPTIVVMDYDPAWAKRFRQEATKIRAALGEAALAIEHIGSTSVSGLAAPCYWTRACQLLPRRLRELSLILAAAPKEGGCGGKKRSPFQHLY